MFARPYVRSLIPTLLILLLVPGMVVLVVVERLHSDEREVRPLKLRASEGLARESSLCVQYNAQDASAYTLGHLEQREEYAEHEDAFDRTVGSLQAVSMRLS
ncbi:hypothetical protein GBA65_19110 [Rubrobacter marinus]|uniref:Uncharacterized protein n=1 Tax=Rubrobacter marinus TaxID=2653852 RepID=A0A6G8Q1D6_9ACTN|nr:hypothetical protein [Rubrobacter marinus]QIN80281.1 hypothetical protein GBA65_19110 [Rubrobacter marinus]